MVGCAARSRMGDPCQPSFCEPEAGRLVSHGLWVRPDRACSPSTIAERRGRRRQRRSSPDSFDRRRASTAMTYAWPCDRDQNRKRHRTSEPGAASYALLKLIRGLAPRSGATDGDGGEAIRPLHRNRGASCPRCRAQAPPRSRRNYRPRAPLASTSVEGS